MDAPNAKPVNRQEVAGIRDDLHWATDRLEEIFPGRRFTLDHYLADSVGKVAVLIGRTRRLGPWRRLL